MYESRKTRSTIVVQSISGYERGQRTQSSGGNHRTYWFELDNGKAKLTKKKYGRKNSSARAKTSRFISSDVTQGVRKHLKDKYKSVDTVGI